MLSERQRLGQRGGSGVGKQGAADKKTGQKPHSALAARVDQGQVPGAPLVGLPAGAEAERKGRGQGRTRGRGEGPGPEGGATKG